jgi:hypothetical protein
MFYAGELFGVEGNASQRRTRILSPTQRVGVLGTWP